MPACKYGTNGIAALRDCSAARSQFLHFIGWIYDKDGHIVTNFHVLGNALQQLSKAGRDSDRKVARVTLLGQSPPQQLHLLLLSPGGRGVQTHVDSPNLN
jgi:S1-C subfamily serine protease